MQTIRGVYANNPGKLFKNCLPMQTIHALRCRNCEEKMPKQIVCIARQIVCIEPCFVCIAVCFVCLNCFLLKIKILIHRQLSFYANKKTNFLKNSRTI